MVRPLLLAALRKVAYNTFGLGETGPGQPSEMVNYPTAGRIYHQLNLPAT